MENLAKVGEVVELKRGDEAAVKERMHQHGINAEPEKLTFADYFVRTISVMVMIVCIAAGAAGGYLLLSDIAGGLVGGIFGACLAVIVDLMMVVSYLKKQGEIIRLAFHVASFVFLSFGAVHLMTASEENVNSGNTELQIASAKLAANNLKINEYETAKAAIDAAEEAYISAKNKPVKDGAVWEVTDGCTATGKASVSHPKDCAAAKAAQRNYYKVKADLPATDVSKLQADNAKIKDEYPSLLLNQGKIAESALDKSVIEQMLNISGLKIDLSTCYLIIGLAFSLIIQFVMASGIKTFIPAQNSPKSELSGFKPESKAGIKSAAKKINVFGWAAQIAESAAMEKARVTANLEHAERMTKSEAVVLAERAILDIKPYLAKMSANTVGAFLISTGALEGFNKEACKKMTKAAFWAVNSYEPGANVLINDLVSEIEGRGMESSSFVNYSFVQRKLLPVLAEAGIVENYGTERRSKYRWSSEQDLIEVVREFVKAA